jgi:hypothetical protein
MAKLKAILLVGMLAAFLMGVVSAAIGTLLWLTAAIMLPVWGAAIPSWWRCCVAALVWVCAATAYNMIKEATK